MVGDSFLTNSPKADSVWVVETPSCKSACLSSRDMEVYASDRTNRMAGETIS